MVVLPPDFVKTKYPGYFWHTVEKKLYTIKVSGELRPIKYFYGGTFYGKVWPAGYRISVKGERRLYTLEYLNSLQPTDRHQVIGVE